MNKFLSIGQVSKLLSVSLSTLYRWLKTGKIKESFRTLGQHRRFNLNQLEQQFFNKEKPNKVAIYSRVSSHDQKKDLVTQQEKLIHYCKINNFSNVEIISDLGSGLNYNKSGLKKLISLILNQQINVLVLNHKDRLLRFGSEIIFSLCSFYNIKVIILEEKELSFEQDLVNNVIVQRISFGQLMTVFCAKLYSSRSHKNKIKPLQVG